MLNNAIQEFLIGSRELHRMASEIKEFFETVCQLVAEEEQPFFFRIPLGVDMQDPSINYNLVFMDKPRLERNSKHLAPNAHWRLDDEDVYIMKKELIPLVYHALPGLLETISAVMPLLAKSIGFVIEVGRPRQEV